ncbi:beta-galactosidase 5-like [Vigna radiata var. radiata]|uniref:beta-galactosidase n=1 Tax=Vigna radiata var. radiata TaxID=3916 RepID=A0A3Q0FL96_VIGRR|nr:beta-galactosidase 5-like [Vigna radiata var. radiata]
MQGFTEKILGMIKSEQLFESHGGPIILSQIENEYGAQNKLQGAASQNYVNWAAKRAVEMGTGVPWVMCKEDGNWRGWSKRKNHPYISKKGNYQIISKMIGVLSPPSSPQPLAFCL